MTTQLTLFDYGALDSETRVSLRQRAERINERTRNIARDIWENGREFYEAQQELAQHGYGSFIAWAESETGYSKNTVYNYIRVYEQFDCTTVVQSKISPKVLYLLAAPSTPEEAREEAVERASSGETITHGAARAIVNEHKTPAKEAPQPTELDDPLDDYEAEIVAGYEARGENPLGTTEASQERAAQEEPELVDETLDDHEVTVTGQTQVVDPMDKATPVSSLPDYDGNEWYTPSYLIEAARLTMGGIDLDPASNDVAQEVVQASTYYTKESNGLTQPWNGRVWMNPPYSCPQDFTVKAAQEYQEGRMQQAIILVNNCTETEWFHKLAQHASVICLLRRRAAFWYPGRRDFGARQGQVVFGVGVDLDRFVKVFSDLGIVLKDVTNEA